MCPASAHDPFQRRQLSLAVAGFCLSVPALSAAMDPEPPNNTAPLAVDRSPRHAIAINPVFIPFGTLSGEYELRATRLTTLGLSGWYEYRDVRARWLYLKALVYPWRRALDGFGLGLTAGVLRAYRDPADAADMPSDTTPTLGAMAQYNYLLGPNDLCLLGTGIGARTPLKHIAEDSPLKRVDGDVRIVAGVAF